MEVAAGGSGGAPVTPGSHPPVNAPGSGLNIVLYAVALLCVAAIGCSGRGSGRRRCSDGFWDHSGRARDPESESRLPGRRGARRRPDRGAAAGQHRAEQERTAA